MTFVQKRSGATAMHLRRLAAQYGQQEDERAPAVVVVVDGADARESETLKNELGLDFTAIADPEGKITDRFGIDVWPTTITLDPSGIVSEVEVGVAARGDRESLRGEDASGHSAV